MTPEHFLKRECCCVRNLRRESSLSDTRVARSCSPSKLAELVFYQNYKAIVTQREGNEIG